MFLVCVYASYMFYTCLIVSYMFLIYVYKFLIVFLYKFLVVFYRFPTRMFTVTAVSPPLAVTAGFNFNYRLPQGAQESVEWTGFACPAMLIGHN